MDPTNLPQMEIDTKNKSIKRYQRMNKDSNDVIDDDKYESSGEGRNVFDRKKDETHFDEELEGDDDSLQVEGEGSGDASSPEFTTENLTFRDSIHLNPDADIFVNQRSIHVEVIYCVCESWNGHWKRTFRYPDLRCLEVNRVLPVLSVATCIVTAGGAILSGVVLYLLWASKESFYDPIRPSEIRPIVFSSSLKRNNSVQSKINGVPYWNGNGVSTPLKGNSRHYI